VFSGNRQGIVMDFSRQLDRAEALFGQGLEDQAAEIFELILRHEPENARALNDLGVFHHRRGRKSEAESCFRKAVDAHPDHVEALRNLAGLYEETGRSSEAADCYGRIRDLTRESEKGSGKKEDLKADDTAEFSGPGIEAPGPETENSVSRDSTPARPERSPAPVAAPRMDLRPLNILFVQDAPCIRNYKTATALRSRGHRISLAYTRARLSQVYPALSDDVYFECIHLKGLRHLWDIAPKYDLIHCHNEPDQLTVAALAGKTPVIHDTHDLISLRHGGDPNLVYLEGIANRGAAGRIYVSSYQRDRALELYGIDLDSSAVVHNYVLRRMVPETGLSKLSSEDGEIHVVYEGGLGSAGVPHRYYLPVFRELIAARIHVHMYPSFQNPEYEREAAGNPYLHYYAPVSPERIVFEMTRYDFGIVPFVVTPENERHLHSAMPNKLFEYLAAGLPVIANDLKSIREFFNTYPVGVLYRTPEEIAGKLRTFPRSLPDNVPFVFEEQIGLVEAVYRKVLEGDETPHASPGTGPPLTDIVDKPPSAAPDAANAPSDLESLCRRVEEALRQGLQALSVPESWKAFHARDLEIYFENLRRGGEAIPENTEKAILEHSRVHPMELREILSLTPSVFPGFVALLGALCKRMERGDLDSPLNRSVERRCRDWMEADGIFSHTPEAWYRARNLAPGPSCLDSFLLEENTYWAAYWLEYPAAEWERRFREAYDFALQCLERSGVPEREPMFPGGDQGLQALDVSRLRFLELSFRAADAVGSGPGADIRKRGMKSLLEAISGLEETSVPEEGPSSQAYLFHASAFERLNLLYRLASVSSLSERSASLDALRTKITTSFESLEATAPEEGRTGCNCRRARRGYVETVLLWGEPEQALRKDLVWKLLEEPAELSGKSEGLPAELRALFGYERIHRLNSLLECRDRRGAGGGVQDSSATPDRGRADDTASPAESSGEVCWEIRPDEEIRLQRPLEG
jgi:glycosyltransferase involved in cell wall biosynthesis